MKLNLGAGECPVEGYVSVDRKRGQECYPLDYPDESAEEIRASHILEHFSHWNIGSVLADWARVLKPGGLLKIAVPDFEWIARQYLSGKPIPTQTYVMGGHEDEDDHHGAVFDEEALTDALKAAGLVGITRWKSEVEDCASLDVSLNLQAYKPQGKWPKTAAVMSVPRLGFMDNFFCAVRAIQPLGISLQKYTGAFWGQCLTRVMEEVVDDVEFILTIDYDTVYTRNDVEALLSAAVRHPLADAIAALQVARTKTTPLFTIRRDGKAIGALPWEETRAELMRVSTAHFGLTLIRAEKLKQLPRPWFQGQPDADGHWGEGRIDDDIWFWRQWEKQGYSLCVANRVPVGHGEMMIRWPNRDFEAMYQHPSEFWKQGKPEDVWR